jgi:transposase
MNRVGFLKHYHKRSNAESTFSMMKAKFCDGLRSKNAAAQVNEAIYKILAHNISVVIQSMYEFVVGATFLCR